MRWIVSYDISDHGARRKIARRLETLGARVQYSVFELDLDADARSRLSRELEEQLREDSDSIRWYPLCQSCRSRVLKLGQGRYLDQGGEYLLF